MPGADPAQVVCFSDLEPEPQRFDLNSDIDHVIPRTVVSDLIDHPTAADLWTIAATCSAVDRNLRRPAGNAWHRGLEWHRAITVRVPVLNPGWWHRHKGSVEALLAWLTSDTWNLEPVPGDGARPRQDTLPLDEPHGRPVLFSGGLDSVCGIIDEFPRSEEPLYAVSVSTNSRMKSRQKTIFDALRRADGRLSGWHPFRLEVHLPNREDSARSRGFVFLTAGVLSAMARGANTLWLYENGPGALNLALTRGQVGAQAARAVHPKTLRGMERVARAVSGDPAFRIENRAADRTKAQMVERVPSGGEYDRVLSDTISCDTGFSNHSPGAAHCGGCTSCVLRRQALAAAGRGVRTPARRTPGHKREHAQLMGWQVARMRSAIRGGLSWERMVREFPDLVCDPDSFRPERREDLLRLFEQYAAEWDLDGVVEEFGNPSL